MKIPLSKIPLAGNEIELIQEVLDSGWLTTSSKAKLFEESFADYVKAKYACAVNSCTSALHLAVEAIGVEPGDKVFVPALTFTATAEVVRYMGADPILLDVEYETGIISPQILDKAISKHPEAKALILVHYGGRAARMTTPDGRGILDICRKNNIKLIEDAAHAFPTRFGDRYIGSFGDVSCFSFYANKTITTGEGGMLLTNNKSIYERAKIMRLHGIDRDIWNRYNSNGSSWEYDVIAPGYKYNMPDINAAIGLAQLQKAELWRKERQRCAAYYYKELSQILHIDLHECNNCMDDHAWHLFPIFIQPGSPIKRNEFMQKLSEEGIGTSVHYKPLYRMSYYKNKYNLNPDKFPNTERFWQGTVSLPIYPELQEQELNYICMTIRKIIEMYRIG